MRASDRQKEMVDRGEISDVVMVRLNTRGPRHIKAMDVA